ncbi:aminoglycoside phosphotransferase family protein [Streptomyces sp. PH10-H1]|uniref:aminoglycoside phosphotransferase family protein n=1 Tax=Streptomyces sp. PH10-H1 TaxID=3046212 RepID=UPI0024BBACD8|nr:aminoglycoside phosphotransferase family protein [Streptomyces sp. PH10-H1]MDJ0345070.1 aminoglycoside phosphotransferase family protein [Streptomyces sp. PH10-H1]
MTTCQKQPPSAVSWWDELLPLAASEGTCLSGYHNLNYVHRLPPHLAESAGLAQDTRVKVRTPRSGSLKVVERVWPDEDVVLDALAGVDGIADTPRCFARQDGFSVHEYVEGTPLSRLCGPGKPVDPRYLDLITGQLAAFTRGPAADLPPLPKGWARDQDCGTFLRERAEFAEREVRARNWREFGALFTALGVPANALRGLRDRTPEMAPRPFALLHADLHRDNLIVRNDGDLCLVDWELAMWGDPLHDLAVHLVRMRYPAYQEADVIERWQRDVAKVRREAGLGLDRDLPAYIAYERAQSLFADTMRIARALGPQPDPGLVGTGVALVRDALQVAAEPLRLRGLPTLTEVERILLGWCRRPVTATRAPSTSTVR